MFSLYNCTLNSSLVKCDCTAGRQKKSSKQGFISLVFQAAVFSLSTAGSSRGRGSRHEERLLMRCGGRSINWGRYGCCYSFACYPVVGCLPDLEALTYLRDSVSHRAQLLLRRPQCLTITLQSQPSQQQQEDIRSCACSISTTEIYTRPRFGSYAGHGSALCSPIKACVCVVPVRL